MTGWRVCLPGAVVDGETGRIVTTQLIGKGVDATEFDVQRKLVYFSCGDGTMWVFRQDSPDKYTLVETVKTQTGARTMAVDHKSVRHFSPLRSSGLVRKHSPDSRPAEDRWCQGVSPCSCLGNS